MREKRLSRRDFNKIALAGSVLLGVETLGLKLIVDNKRKNSPLLSQEERRLRELSIYGEEGLGTIAEIEEHSGLTVSLPGTLSFNNPYTNERLDNSAWTLKELEIVKRASKKLPKKARETRKMAFGVIRSDKMNGIGGFSPEGQNFGFRLPFVIIITPKQYDLNENSSEAELWINKADELQAVFMHEMTHLVVERDPSLIGRFNKYLEDGEWQKDGNQWHYVGGESRVIDFMKRKGLSGTKHWRPEEDIAHSSMLYTTNPRYLVEGPESDQKRFIFLSSEIFSGALYF